MNKRYYEHTLPIIRGSLSNTYVELQGLLLQMLPERQGFREKYRSRARMIFPGKPRKGPDLVVRTEAFATFAL